MNQNANSVPVSIVIPSYRREQVLIDTIRNLLQLATKAGEIIVVDQSTSHEQAVSQQLTRWHEANRIKWIRLSEPCIPAAMNTGLLQASYDIVLFVDDDIKAHESLIKAHYAAHRQAAGLIVAGRVVQPWDDQRKLSDQGHRFNSDEQKSISHFMGGNFSLNKLEAIRLGGFDENFIGVAYCFEKEFSDRWLKSGKRIFFEPDAAIDHLQQPTGGTREYGEHLTTIQPFHAVGAYYYLLNASGMGNKTSRILARLMQSVTTRHHLKRPWFIPVTLIAEIRGLIRAIKLYRSGPKYIAN